MQLSRDTTRFDAVMDDMFGVGSADPIGVAVSGGGDSLALLHILAQWAAENGREVMAVTVDHGLRPEAAEEAKFVSAQCRTLAVPHTTLKWIGWDGSGNLQDQARQARYRLIGAWAAENGIAAVALGHTADDQAETFLMRLAREAGIDGLAAMARQRDAYGVTWMRPLLGMTRADLRRFLTDRAVDWIEDPSNNDDGFERIKIRKMMGALTPLGLTVERLAAVADHLGSVQNALDVQTAAAAQTLARIDGGDVCFDRDGLFSLPDEIGRRLLVHALKWVASSAYPPRRKALADAKMALLDGRDATLGGCRLMVEPGHIRITRETQAVRDTTCPIPDIWDQRWRAEGPENSGYRIAILGENGISACPDWRQTGRPRASILASPAIWDDDQLVAAPLAGWNNGWRMELVNGENDFFLSILSH